MRIWLDYLELNNPDLRIYLDEPIEGLSTPSIRTSGGTRAGAHGSYIGSQLYDGRKITLTGRLFASDVTEAKATRRAMQAALDVLYPSQMTMRILDDDGMAYTLQVNILDFYMPILRWQGKAKWKIELEATDPDIYDDNTGSALTSTIHVKIPGGLLFSSTSPVFGSTFKFSAGSSNDTVTNPGTITVYPIITISGQISSPVLINRTTGEIFSMTGYLATTGTTTVIDMYNHTVTQNGGSVMPSVDLSSRWWGLVPGANEIEFQRGNAADVTTATLTWRPGYRGI